MISWEQSKRFNSFDSVTGLLIFWMIGYHALQWANLKESEVYQSGLKLFFFFMTWFYFKSGFFYGKRSTLERITHDFKKLIIPMLFWGGVGYLFLIPQLLIVESQPLWKVIVWPFYSLIISGDIIGNAPLWFLLSLFLVRATVSFLINLDSLLIVFFMLCFFCAGFFLSSHNAILPLGLSTLPLGVFFCLYGVLLRRLGLIENSFNKVLFFLIWFGGGFVFTSQFSYIDFHRNSVLYGDYWSYVSSSMVMLILFLLLFRFFNLRFITWVGKKSMYFLVLHWPFFIVVKYIYSFVRYESNLLYAFLLFLGAFLSSIIFALFFTERAMFFELDDIFMFYRKIQIKYGLLTKKS